VLDSVGDPFSVVDRNGRFLFASQSTLDTCGKQEDVTPTAG